MQETMAKGKDPDVPYRCIIEKKKIPYLTLKNYISTMEEKGCDYFFGIVYPQPG